MSNFSFNNFLWKIQVGHFRSGGHKVGKRIQGRVARRELTGGEFISGRGI